MPLLSAFRKSCHEAANDLLDLFTIALKIENDPSYFRSRHTYGGSESLRLLSYPPLPQGGASDIEQDAKTEWAKLKVGEKDIRAGAHQDFGSV